MNIFTKLFVSIFYIGYIKFASGTWGSLAAILLLYPCIKFTILPFEGLIVLFIILFFISNLCINLFSNFTNSKDSKHIVIDELLGIFIILIFYDFVYIYNDFITLILIFFIFRLFDIIKIFPANYIDKNLKNGYGVIMDDIVAGIYTIFTLMILNVFI
ncbi:phosphatidylglycerophosphatase A [Alphaproteobacteria bacterium]|nr:phosphatidylglycerophosphatase A [Alphaproteobacteria bacterium]